MERPRVLDPDTQLEKTRGWKPRKHAYPAGLRPEAPAIWIACALLSL